MKHNWKNVSTDSLKMDTGIPLFFSEIEYLLLETIPLETIMRDAVHFEQNHKIVAHVINATIFQNFRLIWYRRDKKIIVGELTYPDSGPDCRPLTFYYGWWEGKVEALTNL